MKLIIAANGTSENHGCEAITHSTLKILGNMFEKVYCSTTNLSYEKELPGNAEWVEYSYFRKPTIKNRVISKAEKVVFHKNNYEKNKPWLENIIRAYDFCDVMLSAGGDNYCNGEYEWLYALNDAAKVKGLKTVLWGCSVDEECFRTPKMMADLLKYDLIIARESLTYQILSSFHPNVRLFPDPAFALSAIKKPWPQEVDTSKGVVGVNISPTSIACEQTSGLTRMNYERMIQYILEETPYAIGLIPHVIFKKSGGDLQELLPLYKKYQSTGRVLLLRDQSCEELKGYIAQCKFFVTARTHASIAAYSSSVPTLVLGYSIKARGIAKDLFGTEDGYVLPVQNLHGENDLKQRFQWLQKNEQKIHEILNEKMKSYIPQTYQMREVLEELLNMRNS